MDRKYSISGDKVLSAFMFSHCKSCGWEYCILIHDAWKYSATLKNIGVMLGDDLSDLLIVECNSLELAEQLCDRLSGIQKITVWKDGILEHTHKGGNDGQY